MKSEKLAAILDKMSVFITHITNRDSEEYKNDFANKYAVFLIMKLNKNTIFIENEQNSLSDRIDKAQSTLRYFNDIDINLDNDMTITYRFLFNDFFSKSVKMGLVDKDFLKELNNNTEYKTKHDYFAKPKAF